MKRDWGDYYLIGIILINVISMIWEGILIGRVIFGKRL